MASGIKKLFLVLALTLCVSACGDEGEEINLSGNLTEYSAKNYTIQLPEECEVIASEISDISAQYEDFSVAVISMPLDQAVVCEDKDDFQEHMDSLGYNMEAEDYEKREINGMEAYFAEYLLSDARFTQITYAVGDTAYIATYARPADMSGNADEIFIKGMESFSLSGKD